MKKILLTLILGILLLSFASAEIQFFQKKFDFGNGTIQNYMIGSYAKTFFGVTDDYVKGDNKYEISILYNIYPKTWNTNNPNHKITYCEMRIEQYGSFSNDTRIVFIENYTSNSSDVKNAQYFLRLDDGGGFYAYQTCYFQNQNYHALYLPMEMQLVTPTWECKSCQYFNWAKDYQSIAKSETIGDFIITNSGYIQKLFNINFEIILSLFWFALIVLIFISIGLLFFGVYYFYLYLKTIAK